MTVTLWHPYTMIKALLSDSSTKTNTLEAGLLNAYHIPSHRWLAIVLWWNMQRPRFYGWTQSVGDVSQTCSILSTLISYPLQLQIFSASFLIRHFLLDLLVPDELLPIITRPLQASIGYYNAIPRFTSMQLTCAVVLSRLDYYNRILLAFL